MGYFYDKHIKYFCQDKTIAKIIPNKKFPTEIVKIVFTDGTYLELFAVEKKNCFSHKAQIICTPKGKNNKVIQSTTIEKETEE